MVGAGASGTQIAEELQKAGKTVYLSVGEHYRPPRAYRGRDYCWWLGALGLWDEVKIQPKKKHVAFAVSGYEGGKTVDFRRLAHQGINLVGVTEQWNAGVMTFAQAWPPTWRRAIGRTSTYCATPMRTSRQTACRSPKNRKPGNCCPTRNAC